MKRIAIPVLVLLAAAVASTAAAHSEKHVEKGRPAHGYLSLGGQPPGAKQWLVVVRKGRRGPSVARGEGFSSHLVRANGVFHLKLEPGTYTLGAQRQIPGDEAQPLCGLTSVVVRANASIPAIRIHCRRGP
jgi:hypothetical protein